jgi:ubiquinone/menaquinone biosynthesis C-methylase UbiE
MSLQQRLERERQHGQVIINTAENNWGWNTSAGVIRWRRRFDYLAHSLSNKDGIVLEVGAGSGTFTTALANEFPNLSAIDICEDLLKIARSKAPLVNFLCMDAHNLQFPDNYFDAIIGCSVLHHLDWDLALKGFFKKLKPNGIIRFSEPNLLNPQIFLQKNIPLLKKHLGDSPDEYAFTSWQIKKSLKEAGYSQISVVPFEFLHPATPVKWIEPVIQIESWLSRTFISNIGGSLMIEGIKL